VAHRRGRRRALVLVLTLALVLGAIYIAVSVVQRSENVIVERCTAVAGAQRAELATDQAANAALISGEAVKRGLPARAATIALATAMQESKLRNIRYGDEAGPDSRGLFQQRPSQGWGTEEQVMDPHYASGAFYTALVKVPDYEGLEITAAAQQVQRSAFPRAYAQHEGMARAFASALTGQSTAALDCTLRAPEEAGDPQAVLDELTSTFGDVPASLEGSALVVQASESQAWAIAQWAVANAKQQSLTAVDVAGYSWLRESRNGWQPSGAPDGRVSIAVATQDSL
jgi:hypothetical protein